MPFHTVCTWHQPRLSNRITNKSENPGKYWLFGTYRSTSKKPSANLIKISEFIIALDLWNRKKETVKRASCSCIHFYICRMRNLITSAGGKISTESGRQFRSVAPLYYILQLESRGWWWCSFEVPDQFDLRLITRSLGLETLSDHP